MARHDDDDDDDADDLTEFDLYIDIVLIEYILVKWSFFKG